MVDVNFVYRLRSCARGIRLCAAALRRFGRTIQLRTCDRNTNHNDERDDKEQRKETREEVHHHRWLCALHYGVLAFLASAKPRRLATKGEPAASVMGRVSRLTDWSIVLHHSRGPAA